MSFGSQSNLLCQLQTRNGYPVVYTARHPERIARHPERIARHPERIARHPERIARHPERIARHPERLFVKDLAVSLRIIQDEILHSPSDSVGWWFRMTIHQSFLSKSTV
ncbi:MAG TPA: hypothetical protein ENH10_05975 [Bacteroidetes bacterium]|nr:hypothetical protein [Bacteroidota bacterium]HEX04692.1 hypothetical protein [Bacteroidota bacterium]